MKRSVAQNRALTILSHIDGVRVGRIVNVDANGHVLVDFPGNTRGPIRARFTDTFRLKISNKLVSTSRDVLIVFENNDPDRPIIVDTLHIMSDQIIDSSEHVSQVEETEDFLIDGRRVAFDAKRDIVLRCGEASITLTRAGKIVIRGAYVVSRSSGVNRIKGGSVQIN